MEAEAVASDIYPEYMGERLYVERQICKTIQRKSLVDRFVPVRTNALTVREWLLVIRKAADNIYEKHFFIKLPSGYFRVTYFHEQKD